MGIYVDVNSVTSNRIRRVSSEPFSSCRSCLPIHHPGANSFRVGSRVVSTARGSAATRVFVVATLTNLAAMAATSTAATTNSFSVGNRVASNASGSTAANVFVVTALTSFTAPATEAAFGIAAGHHGEEENSERKLHVWMNIGV